MNPADLAAAAHADVLESLDQTWAQLIERVDGVGADEYLWQPAPVCWTVHPDADGGVTADRSDDDPIPAPITTIAWRMWHIAVDCLDSYSVRITQRTGTGLTGAGWVLDPTKAVELMAGAWSNFRQGFVEIGPGGMFDLLGPAWGPYSESTILALALHAQHEVAHHGAEIALLRDLYPHR